ncbi:MAG: hypothetical protein COV44_05140 [Deltaproteobacteria bacterium CG11_big_fil_rev_8_21_14_0_20_45_16]|nr:MAG: hypothetical protein COV44_05140 [Deltaproteobacteria bacterium CG11_big_fil_rev_8_21_14_0_20_45_16]
MIIGLGGYSPSNIFKRRRDEERRFSNPVRRARVIAQNAATKNAHASAQEQQKPEGEAGLIWEAAEYIYLSKKVLAELTGTYARLMELCDKALNLKIADTERKAIDRQFQGAVRNFDYVAVNGQVKGDAIFSGDLYETPKILKLNSSGTREINLSIKSMRSESLRLHLIKVDSIVNARKGEKRLTEIQKEFKKVSDFLNNKDLFLDVSFKDKGLVRPNFEVLEKIASGDATAEMPEDAPLEEEIVVESLDPKLIVLKKRQAKAAEAKGRQMALLVNLII